MLNPTKPDLVGIVQTKTDLTDKTIYTQMGEIALWKHSDSKYTLRGYIKINGTRYHVGLSENGESKE